MALLLEEELFLSEEWAVQEDAQEEPAVVSSLAPELLPLEAKL